MTVNMSIPPEEAVVALLVEDAAIAMKVGFSVHAMTVPAGETFPFIAYSRQSVERASTLGGPLAGPSNFTVALEVVVYAETYTEAREIAIAVRKKLDGFSGEAYGLEIGGIQMTGESDDTVVFGGEQLASAYQVTMTFSVRWKE